METYVNIAQVEAPVITNEIEQDSLAPYFGVSVLVYVLLLFMFAPRRNRLNRRKSSL